MIKKSCFYLLGMVFFALLSAVVSFGLDADDISAEGCVVYYPFSDDILFEKNADKRLSMASTTKIMTCIVALENCDIDSVVTVKQDMIDVEGSSAGLEDGMIISLKDLLYCLMLPSGNEAANVIALTVSGSLTEFAGLMNRTADKIGMKNSNFVTPSGLDDEYHYTTAYDMALLTSYALNNSLFCEICSTYSYTVETADGRKLYLTNHNRLLNEFDTCFGVKTGFTKKSGRCLISAFKKDGAVIVIVTLNAPDDWNDHRLLYRYGYENLKKITLKNSKFEIKCLNGETARAVSLYDYVYVPSFYDDIGIKILLPDFVYAPVYKYTVMGKTLIIFKNKTACVDIYSESEIKYVDTALNENIIERFIGFFKKLLRKIYE